MPEFETVTLRTRRRRSTATFVPNAGMVGISLADDGVELLGQRRGLDAYVAHGKTMGIPILYPWANRLSANKYGVDGAVVTLTRAPAACAPTSTVCPSTACSPPTRTGRSRRSSNDS